MISNNVNSVLSMLLLLQITECHYFSNENCQGFGGQMYYEITCVNITTFPNDLPKKTGSLSVTCPKEKTEKRLVSISAEELSSYTYLTKFTLQNCPVIHLPDKLFINNPYLKSVTLENLPLKQLRHLFYGCSNLLELSIVGLQRLEFSTASLLVRQPRFSRLTISNSSLSANIVAEVLRTVAGSIRELSWTHMTALRLPSFMFASLTLGRFSFTYNRMLDWRFMESVKAKILKLQQSKADFEFDMANYSRLAEHTKYMDISEIGLHGRFPNILPSRPLMFLTHLSLRSNLLTSLHDKLEIMLPQLRYIDISHNRIVRLQPALQALFFVIRHLRLEGNPLHCNCQLRWLSARYKFKIKDRPKCRDGFRKPDSGSSSGTGSSTGALPPDLVDAEHDLQINHSNSWRNIDFTELTSDRLICIPPRSPVLSIIQSAHDDRLHVRDTTIITEYNKTDIRREYTLILGGSGNRSRADRPGGLVGLACETEGDPSPSLTWSNQSGVLMSIIGEPGSFSSRLLVDINSRHASAVYICAATNVEGVSFALINVKQRPMVLPILKQTQHGSSACRQPLISIFLLILIFLRIF